MKRIGITGSWRIATKNDNPQVHAIEAQVREDTRAVITQGNGIVAGGPLGVDFWATDEAMRITANPACITVILPTPLDTYIAHFKKRCGEGVITPVLCNALCDQLVSVSKHFRLIEMGHTVCDEKTYYDRNSQVIAHSDEMLAYVANATAGAMDAVTKAQEHGLRVQVRHYTI